MSLYALGDIHGCYHALSLLVDYVPIAAGDLVISLGDYVDRGPDSRRVTEWIIEKTANGECLPLRGNHEIMMLDALTGRIPMRYWLQYGGQETLDSYSPNDSAGTPEDIPIDHLRFFDRELVAYYETPTHVFVHATVEAGVPLKQQSPQSLYWDRFDSQIPLDSGKTVICGHTAQKSGRPLNHQFAVCIDTWAYGKGWLTCLDVHSGQYWQANQSGQTRTDWLDAPAS